MRFAESNKRSDFAPEKDSGTCAWLIDCDETFAKFTSNLIKFRSLSQDEFVIPEGNKLHDLIERAAGRV